MRGAAGRLARGVAVAALAALAAGCATRSPAPGPAPGADGPPLTVPPDLAQRPDPVPRVEPLRVGGPNRPYEVFGRRYEPMTQDLPLRETGLASWYGRRFHGLPTSTGEPFDMFALTAAHRTMPLPSWARVRNPANGRELVVRVNDRGPFVDGRVIDLSWAAALRLGLLAGVAPVEVTRLTHDDIRSGRWRGAEPTAVAAAPAWAPAPSVSPASAARPLPDDPAPGEGLAPGRGFWLQLGAFRDAVAAQSLQRQLLAASAAPLPGVAVRAEAGVFRVQAGPWATREAAQQAAAALQRALGLPAPLTLQR
jgi:rare lipoprotein A